MKTLSMLLMLTATLSALGIASDMRRLKVNRVGLSPPGWVVACIFGNLIAVLLYLVVRRRVWKKLLDAAWHFVGDEAAPYDARRTRLDALRDNGVVGEPIYRACVRTLVFQRTESAQPADSSPHGGQTRKTPAPPHTSPHSDSN
jgi:hypothetical protein